MCCFIVCLVRRETCFLEKYFPCWYFVRKTFCIQKEQVTFPLQIYTLTLYHLLQLISRHYLQCKVSSKHCPFSLNFTLTISSHFVDIEHRIIIQKMFSLGKIFSREVYGKHFSPHPCTQIRELDHRSSFSLVILSGYPSSIGTEIWKEME